MQKEEAESTKILSDAGYTFTKAKPDDIVRAVVAMKPYWDEWANARGADMVEAVAKVRAALGR
jgi:TRAP-type C4-dicarboxylate transport system substrate-binding protein